MSQHRPAFDSGRLLSRSVFVLATLWVGMLPAGIAAQQFDVLIRGARVLDGTGNPWYRADVALQGDRIAAIGDLTDAVGTTEIDGTGLFLTPGFIDTHSHAGGGLATPGLSHARPLLAQGLTTILADPDGGGAVDLAVRKVELTRDGLGVNVGLQVSHGSIRREVMGTAGRLATAAELDRMRALVRAGMEEGAFGLSSGPFYVPGSYSDTHELVELSKVAAEYGGSYSSHIRDEASYSVGLVAAVDELITVAREARIPVVWSHAKALGPTVWGFSNALVHRIDQARAEGLEVYADQYPYTASATGLSAALVPRWAQAGGGFQERMSDPETRARIIEEMWENLARRGGADRIQFRSYGADPSIEGRTLDDLARENRLDAVGQALALMERGGVSIVSFNMHEDDVRTIMAQPWTMTASDGDLGPMGRGVSHPRSYGTFPRKIRQYVVQEGVIDLAVAIRSMTALPAQVFRIPDRGVIRVGAFADLVVFDLDRLTDVGTYSDPHHLAEGMVHVWVNGQAAIRYGEFTGELAGRVLTKR